VSTSQPSILSTSKPLLTSPAALQYRFEHDFVPAIEKEVGGPVSWFWAVERAPTTRTCHIHALLALPKPLPHEVLQLIWNSANSAFVSYDPRRGAAYYLTKSILSDEVEFGIAAHMPAVLMVDSNIDRHDLVRRT
jgi:hypothetical protein